MSPTATFLLAATNLHIHTRQLKANATDAVTHTRSYTTCTAWDTLDLCCGCSPAFSKKRLLGAVQLRQCDGTCEQELAKPMQPRGRQGAPLSRGPAHIAARAQNSRLKRLNFAADTLFLH